MKYLMLLIPGIFTSQLVLAECDSNKLNDDELVECITVEGAGEDYENWKREYNKIGTGRSREEESTYIIDTESDMSN